MGNDILRQSRLLQDCDLVPVADADLYLHHGLAGVHGEIAVVAGVVIECVAGALDGCIQIADHLRLGGGFWVVIHDLKEVAFKILVGLSWAHSEGKELIGLLVALRDNAAGKAADQRRILAAGGVLRGTQLGRKEKCET
jgi:hypothetical protein